MLQSPDRDFHPSSRKHLMVNNRQLTGDARHIVGPDGERWHVYELAGATYDRRSSLVFECEGTIRRVRGFPADWRILSDAALLDLSWQP